MAQLLIQGDTIPHDLKPDGVTVGRNATNDIVITDDGVSGLHVEIRLSGEAWQVRDLGSSNGTRVNGNRISESELRDGDILAFGPVKCAFVLTAKTPLDPSVEAPQEKPAPARATLASRLGGLLKGVLNRTGK